MYEDTKEPLEYLIHWINEREAIRVKRENGEDKPWTEDFALQHYRFCNVKREDDKVTQWVAYFWRNDYAQHPLLTAAMVLARMFNLPEHLDFLPHWGEYSNWKKWLSDSKEHTLVWRDDGHKCFNGAYLITTCGVKMDKIDYVYSVVEDVVRDKMLRVPCYASLEEYAERLQRVDGLGSFLAAQVVADLKNTPGHPLEKASDWWTWAAPGPGSRRGLARAMKVPRVRDRVFLQKATALYNSIADKLDVRLHMQDFQNCLCEFDKYMRVIRGEKARPKQRYSGTC